MLPRWRTPITCPCTRTACRRRDSRRGLGGLGDQGNALDVALGNAGAAEDQLTLTVLDPTGRPVAVVTENVKTADSDHAMFVIPSGGVEVTPGQTYRLKLSGGMTFGWKYVVGGYAKGAATFNGKPLLPDERSTFLFRTFGTK